MRKVLITGANSYIGQSFEKWAKNKYDEQIFVDTIDMIDGAWREHDFSKYDVIFHVAGLAHADVGKVSEERKEFYYKINTDLAVETAKKAKKNGIKQFVFMSSMIIYGESAGVGHKKVITSRTEPKPANFYGDSKWQADQKIRKLANEEFKVAVVRPPMIYGKGSKGNYPLLAKLTRKIPVFPAVKNERSMLHIDNLCEFLCLLILSEEGGIYFPQNKEYVQTKDMIKEIAIVNSKKVVFWSVLNPLICIVSKIPGKISGMANKAFGNMVYEKDMSIHFEGKYQLFDLKTSIERTEGK